MDRIDDESIWLRSPDFDDVFVRREAAECLESASEVVGGDEVGEVRAQLVMIVVMEAFDGCVLDRAVHPLDLAVGPGMVRLGEAMLDVVGLADHVEAHLPREGGVPVAGLICELDAVVGEDRVDPVGNGFEQMLQELPCRLPVSLIYKLGDGELAGAVDGDKQVKLAFGGFNLGDVHVEEADGIAFEALPPGLVALDIGQA